MGFVKGHVSTGTLSASGDIVGLDLSDCASVAVYLWGSYTGLNQAVFEVANEPSDAVANLQWFTTQMSRQDSAGFETGTGNILDGTLRSWQGSVVGNASFRVRATATLTAPANVMIVGSQYAIEPVAGGTQLAVLSFTTGTSPTTAVGTTVTGLGGTHSAKIYASLQTNTPSASGGTLDVYLQSSCDGGLTFEDYAHFAQLASNTAAVQRVVTVSKGQQQTTPTAIGVGLTPALAANSVVGGDYGDRLRSLAVLGSGWSVACPQTILAIFSA